MQAMTSPLEQRIVLQEVGWETYERLLADHVDRSSPRFAYDRGLLEIKSPSAEHERRTHTLAVLVEVVAEETGVDVLGLGSTTFKRRDLERGFEPDSCFYVQNEHRVRGMFEIDLAIDPPPDLVIEIDISNSSLNRHPMYARIGIPEVWRDDGERVQIFVRKPTGDAYDPTEASEAFPLLTSDVLTRFIGESLAIPRTSWRRSVRAWVRDRGAHGPVDR